MHLLVSVTYSVLYAVAAVIAQVAVPDPHYPGVTVV